MSAADEETRIKDLETRAENLGYEVEPYDSDKMSKGEVLGITAIFTVFVGFIGFAAWQGIKDEKARMERTKKAAEQRKEEAAAFDKWMEDQRRQGKIVIRQRNGEHIAVPMEAYKEAEIWRGVQK